MAEHPPEHVRSAEPSNTLPTCLVWPPQHGQVMYDPLPCQEATANEWAVLGSRLRARCREQQEAGAWLGRNHSGNVTSLTQGRMGGRDCLGRDAHTLVFNVGRCTD